MPKISLPAGTGVWVVKTVERLDVRDRVVGRHAVLDERADALDREEGGVALVHVEDVRVDAERLERADAANAEQQLLADAVLAVAASRARR